MRSSLKPILCSLFLVLLGTSACDAQHICMTRFEVSSDQEACIFGAKNVAPGILRLQFSVPTIARTAQLCEDSCSERYSITKVSFNQPAEYVRLTEKMTSAQEVCQQACEGVVGYYRQWEADTAKLNSHPWIK